MSLELLNGLSLLASLQEAAETARLDRDRLALEVEEAQSLALANAERFATAQSQFVERTSWVRAYEKLIAQLASPYLVEGFVRA